MYVDNDNVEKSGTARQATDDNIMLRTKDEVCMIDSYGKNTDSHSFYLIPIAS
jgi:hypothetical protein